MEMADDQKNIKEATVCYLCCYKFIKNSKNVKVKDSCDYTKRY